MAFLEDGSWSPEDARQFYELIGTGSAETDLVMMIESKGSPVEGELERVFDDGKARLNIGGYYWSVQVPESSAQNQVVPNNLVVARRSDAATATLASLLRAQEKDLKVVISAYKAGGDPQSPEAQATFEISLENARICRLVLNSGGHWGVPSELVSISYRTVKIKSAPQKTSGARGAVRECQFTRT
ncbi:type VI secretion system tube protein Hcp [Variovorax boronicumulans]|uniref:type VI secretion system tube protein Hcp n=1 Tax=Variovorax boronicumulans TaxID=436515 RepID=UPI0012E585C2|nr:type VI secretion system tube protein Hcp [Variovorax boronicumulans]GER13415.1 AraC family transcriptional regulator [Variovorax boronicumulans]